MKNNVSIKIDGVSFVGFKEVYVKRSLDTVSGFFRLTVAVDNIQRFPLKMAQKAEIFINDVQVINGFIERIEVLYATFAGSQSHDVIVEGRDVTADIIDSTLDGQHTYNGPISLESIIRDVLSKLSLSSVNVINNVPGLEPYENDYLVSSSVGDSAFEFLERYARLREVLLTTDGLGNIVITRAEQGSPSASITNIRGVDNFNNIISARMIYDNKKRFSKYRCFSQSQISTLEYIANDTESLTNISGEADDNNIRSSRVFNFLSENNANAEECSKRAVWERNSRIAPSKVYIPVVFGFTRIDSGQIWRPNIIVDVRDDFSDLESQMLLDSVEYSQGVASGSKTQLSFVDKDAYSTALSISRTEEESRLEGRNFGVEYIKAG